MGTENPYRILSKEDLEARKKEFATLSEGELTDRRQKAQAVVKEYDRWRAHFDRALAELIRFGARQDATLLAKHAESIADAAQALTEPRFRAAIALGERIFYLGEP